MKKYNLSNIMKRAWEMVKKAGMTISEGLKRAWKEAKSSSMAELKGSVKQVAWAEDIRTKLVNELKSLYERGADLVLRTMKTEKKVSKVRLSKNYPTFVETLIKSVCSIEDAKWFIENKNAYKDISGYNVAGKIVDATNCF